MKNRSFILTRLVKLGLVFKDFDQNLYNEWYEYCKQTYAQNIFDFAKAWNKKKRKIIK